MYLRGLQLGVVFIMKIGLLFQIDSANMFPWQIHHGLYQKHKVQAEKMKNTLLTLGHSVKVWHSFYDFVIDIKYNNLDIDIIYNAIENCFDRNYNACISSLLEMCSIPYLGNDPYVNIITSDKFRLEQICKTLAIRVPKSVLVNIYNFCSMRREFEYAHIGFPCIIKYRYGTMSYHTKLVYNLTELLHELEYMLSTGNGDVLCQEYIDGKEITVPIIGSGIASKALGVIEYTDAENNALSIYDIAWKTQYDDSVLLKALDESDPAIAKIKSAALKIYTHLNFNDYGRIDFRLNQEGIFYLLEANSMPVLSENGAFDPISYGKEYSFAKVLECIVSSAAKRQSVFKKGD